MSPRDEAEVIRVAAACAKAAHPARRARRRHRQLRAGGAARGRRLLDMAALDAIEWHQARARARAAPGVKMVDVDAETRPHGFELRMHPSTKRLATIGGFVAGGSGGVGSVTYGGLREPGNIVAARVVTVEETTARPRAARRRRAEGQPRLRHHRHHHGAGDAARPGLELDRRDRRLRRLRRGLPLRPRRRARRRRREEAADPDHLADPGEFHGDPRALPGRQEHPDRHDRRAVAGELPHDPRRPQAARSPSRRQTTRARARCRSTSTPGTTPRCSLLKTDRGITYLQCLFPADRLRRIGAGDAGAVRRRGAARTTSSSASPASSPRARCRSCATPRPSG